MQVTKDRTRGLKVYKVDDAPVAIRTSDEDKIHGFDTYRVDGAPVAGRASDEYDDFWYVKVNGLGIYAYVPTADGSDYEEIVIDESYDVAERWDEIVKNPLRLAEIVKREVDATLIDRMMEAGSLKLHFHGSNGDRGYLSGHEAAVGSEADIRKEAAGLAKEFVDVGSGDEDWSGWKIVASTEPDGKGVTVARFGFEELGVWSPKPDVEFDPTESYITEIEAAITEAQATRTKVEAAREWLSKAKSLPDIVETSMVKEVGEKMAPFAKALGKTVGYACSLYPEDEDRVVSCIANDLMNRVGINRATTVAVLERVVRYCDFNADPAEIVASIPTKDEIAAMERKAVESSGISR